MNMLTVFLHFESFKLTLAFSFMYSAQEKKTILCSFKLIQAADDSEQMRGNQCTEEIITLLLYGKINQNNRSTYQCLL